MKAKWRNQHEYRSGAWEGIIHSNALPVFLNSDFYFFLIFSHYILSHPILDFLFYFHKRNESESHWHQKFLIHDKPFYKHLVLFVMVWRWGGGGGRGLESLERLLGKSQPPREKGCIVTRRIQASTCCGTLRGLILQISLKIPSQWHHQRRRHVDHKGSQTERTKIFHTGHL